MLDLALGALGMISRIHFPGMFILLTAISITFALVVRLAWQSARNRRSNSYSRQWAEEVRWHERLTARLPEDAWQRVIDEKLPQELPPFAYHRSAALRWSLGISCLLLIMGAGLLSVWLDLRPFWALAVMVLAGLVVPLMELGVELARLAAEGRKWQRRQQAWKALDSEV